MGAETPRRPLAELDLDYARSRRRAASRRAEPQQRSRIGGRSARAAVLAVLLLGFIAETARVELAPAKGQTSGASKQARLSCGIPAAYAPAFRKASHETGIALSVLAAVGWEESRMNPRAVSGAGARGLLQLMPGTARAVDVGGAAPGADVRAGARYLRQLLARFHGDLELALAAYNAGPTVVEKTGGAPSIATLRYAKNVEARAASLAGCR
jgi:soluble lytic murein transglycosylase-like protein